MIVQNDEQVRRTINHFGKVARPAFSVGSRDAVPGCCGTVEAGTLRAAQLGLTAVPMRAHRAPSTTLPRALGIPSGPQSRST